MATWRSDGSSATFDAADQGWRATVDCGRFACRLWSEDVLLASFAEGDHYPIAPLAARIDGAWQALGRASDANVDQQRIIGSWERPEAEAAVDADPEAGLRLRLRAPGATAVALALVAGPDERFYGLGERFNRLDQRGELVELWVKNGASGGNTYKPVPFFASSAGYGVAIDTSRRVFAALAHPTVPDATTLTVEGEDLIAWLLPGPTPADVVRRYTNWVGRPPIPPKWFFRPWKSRDWRVEDQRTVLEDVAKQREHDIPCGVKLIDATWETAGHSFRFDPAKYPDVPGMMRALREAGVELVLWLSPSMTVGSREYEECARCGFLITRDDGEPYVHRLGNEPGWEGTTIDFSNPAAVDWWQDRLRGLLEIGVRGFKTDFGEQVPEDARFANGKTGREMHNLLPVLYNRASWEVVEEFGGALLARSAWAGSQRCPGIWAGDQSADFSPWAGLPSAIVAGQSAGWSGFPYWGSDIGGYFNPPDDEVFARWAQFAAVSPVMEAHGLGRREPWEFSEATLAIYRRAAQLHDRLVPYSLAAAVEARETGMPLMRAMALLYPDHPDAHFDWVQYQFCYGPSLLAAPVYSWGKARQIWFPPGAWIDVECGERHVGPSIERIPTPIEKLPLFARAGAVIPIADDPASEDLAIDLYAGPDAAPSAVRLPDGTAIAFTPGRGGGQLEVTGPDRGYSLRLPFQRGLGVVGATTDVAATVGAWAWGGAATVEIGHRP